MTPFLMVYVTTPNRLCAEEISQAVLEENLAACANLLPAMESRYHWQGKIETAQEFALLLKTDQIRFEKLKQRILSLHSSKTPCVVAWPLEHGHAPYFQWLTESLDGRSAKQGDHK